MSGSTSVVLELGGLYWATSEAAIEKALRGRPGVVDVAASALSQTALVTYDADRTSVGELTGWVRDCGVPLRRAVRPGARLLPPPGAERGARHRAGYNGRRARP